MTLAIRPAKAQDADAIWAMIGPVFRSGDTYAVDPEIGRDAALAYWQAPYKTVFIAEADQPLGTYFIMANQGGGGAHVCNCGYVTSEAARGRGVARAMLTHSLETARHMGFTAMQYNFVVESNTRAIDTWRLAGFETVGRLPKAFRHPALGLVDALVMWKEL